MLTKKIALFIGAWMLLAGFVVGCIVSETFLLASMGLAFFATISACLWIIIDNAMDTCSSGWK